MSSVTEKKVTAPRLERLQRIMERRNLDGVVVSSYQNVSYFAGTYIMTQQTLPDRLAFLVLPRGGEPSLIVCGIETRQVVTQTDIADVRDYIEFVDNPTEVLAAVLRERGLTGGSLGIDARRLPYASAQI